MDQRKRIEGCLWGAITGDALGVPVEFTSRAQRTADPVTGMRGFGTHRQPPGTWSDDSSLLLCTLESLVECGGFEPEDMGRRFVRWRQEGLWTPHGTVFDIGIATSAALARIEAGVPAREAGGAGERDNGNGSLMRIAPVALTGWREPAEVVVTRASGASAVTHGHPRSRAACAWFCLLLAKILKAGESPESHELLDWAARKAWADFDRVAEGVFTVEAEKFGCLRDLTKLRRRSGDGISRSGYVVDCLIASVWAVATSGNCREAVLKAVNLGEDTDTTGCVTGALAGCLWGGDAVPAEWIGALARREEIEGLVARAVGAE